MITVVEPRIKSTCLSCNERNADRTFNIIIDQRVIVLCQKCLNKLVADARFALDDPEVCAYGLKEIGSEDAGPIKPIGSEDAHPIEPVGSEDAHPIEPVGWENE